MTYRSSLRTGGTALFRAGLAGKPPRRRGGLGRNHQKNTSALSELGH